MTQGIMKAGELAELLGCSVFTIEERARKRELPKYLLEDLDVVVSTLTIEVLK